MLAAFAPDLLLRCGQQQPEQLRSDNQIILTHFQSRFRGDHAPQRLAAIFGDFLRELAPNGLGDTEIQEANPVLFAIRAYYYAFWQAAATRVPGVFTAGLETA